MNITYKLTLNEYQEAVMYHYKKGKKPLLVAVYIGLATFIMLMGTDFSNVREVITNILMVFFAISFYLLFTRMISAYQAKRVYNKSSLLCEEVTLHISGKGITQNKKTSDNPLGWDYFTKRKENENFFLLYTNNHQFNVIPKRAMNEKQLEEFRTYLDKYMSNR
jgi:hypothetical protein